MVNLPLGLLGLHRGGMGALRVYEAPNTLICMNHLMRLIHLIQMGHLKHYHEIVKNLSCLYSICDSVVKILS